MKDNYVVPQMEVIFFKGKNVITTSLGEDETPFVPMSETWE